MQINIRNEKVDISTDPMDIRSLIKKYYVKIDAYKFNNLGQMKQLFERHNLAKLTQGETDNLSRPIPILKN